MPIHDEYARFSNSAQLLQRALQVIPGGANSWTRWTDHTINVARARGARVWDVDGREYLDFHGAYSAIVLGHSYPAVTRAVADQIEELVLVGIGRTPGEVELGERLVRLIPSAEQALLAPSGSDATYSAIRLARAVTGRTCIVKFAGCFHGPHDYALRSASANRTDGVLDAAAQSVITADYNDLVGLTELFTTRGHEIAAVIVEPIAYNASLFPEPGFLGGLRELTTEYDALLIFDEVITGFRTGLGGAQERFGINPDLTTLGKAMGNGFAGAAIVGPERYMSRFAVTPGGTVPYSGTHNGNGVSVAAALATLDVLETLPVHEHLYRLGDRMREGLAIVARDNDVPAAIGGYGSIYSILFTDKTPTTFEDVLGSDNELLVAYREALLAQGILEMPLPLMRGQVTYSHTEADVDRHLEAASRALPTALNRIAARRR